MRLFAKLISVVFHPLFMPLYAGLIILFSNLKQYTFGSLQFKHVFFQILILTLVFPLLMVLIMRGLNIISSFKIENKKERIFPFIGGLMFYLWGVLMFRPESKLAVIGDTVVASMFLGLFISVCLALFITIFDKISIHAISASALIALVLEIFNLTSVNLIVVLVAVIIIAGLVGTSRLILKAHNYNQVLFGYLVGYISMWLGFHFPFF